MHITLQHRFVLLVLVFGSLVGACKKSSVQEEDSGDSSLPESPIVPPKEASEALSSGFFMEGWSPKTFIAPVYEIVTPSILKSDVTIDADYSETISKVSKYIFGTNANTYIGQLVTEPALMSHLKALSPNVIRFPGGNLSSVYFWNESWNSKPADVPDTILYGDQRGVDKEFYWAGKNTPDWSLSLENYYNTLKQTNSAGMITVNYGYARYGTSTHPDRVAAHLAADWVRADKGKTKYWEIGNESSGPWQAGFKIDVKKNKDAQPEIINGTIYGRHFKVFADSMRKAAAETGADIKIGAQLIHYDAANSWNPPDRNWNAEYFAAAGNSADFYIIHDYYTPLGANTGAEAILNSAVSNTQNMISWLNTSTSRAGMLMKPVALTEWNIGAEGNKQMVSHIAGIHATLVLGELIKSKYGMAGRWGIANGYASGNDHGMFGMGDDGTAKWTPRPAFYYMYYFQRCMGDRLFESTVLGNSEVVTYATAFSGSGEVGIAIINKSTNALMSTVNLKNFKAGSRYYYYSLSGDGSEFSRKLFINDIGPAGTAGGPENYKDIKAKSAKINSTGAIKIELPARSVVYLQVDKG